MDLLFRPYRRLPELAHLPAAERDRIWRRLVDDRHLRFGWASNAARAAVWVFVPLIVPVVGLGVWRLSAAEGPAGLPWFIAGLILGMIVAVTCSQTCMFVLLRPHVRRAIRGNCPSCGYDCRATPDRCPECGMDLNPSA